MYQECLELELASQSIEFLAQQEIVAKPGPSKCSLSGYSEYSVVLAAFEVIGLRLQPR